MLSKHVFWLVRENIILFVCDIYACPAINPVVAIAKLIMSDAKLAFLSYSTLLTIPQGMKACAIIKSDISTMPHTNFFDILS